MKGKVLVAVDGASGGRDAIALARVLAPPSARMVLTNVYGVGGDTEPTLPAAGLVGRALHRLARKESAERAPDPSRPVLGPAISIRPGPVI